MSFSIEVQNLEYAQGSLVQDGKFIQVKFFTVPSSVVVGSGSFSFEQIKSGAAQSSLVNTAQDSVLATQKQIDVLNVEINKITATILNRNSPLSDSEKKELVEQQKKLIEQRNLLTNELTGKQNILDYYKTQFKSDADELVTQAEQATEAKAVEETAANPQETTEEQPAPVAAPPENTLPPAADDDTTLEADPAQNQNPSDSKNPGATAGTAPGDTSNTGNPNDKPGKRLRNPLGDYPLVTYQITLYMITPDAYDNFILSGRTKIDAGGNTPDSGVFIVAQSGGVGSNRATGFDLDYYIEDLKIITTTSGKDTQSTTNTTEISFKIVEPYGFSLLSNLNRAQRELQAKSQRIGYKEISNSTRQYFILGIRFLGFNLDGSPITGKEKLFGEEGVPGAGSGQGIFERFYDIVFTDLKFRLDGKAVVYNIRAASIPANTVMGTLKGMIDTGAQVKGDTVGACLEGPNGLLTYLTQYQEKLKKEDKIKIPNRYAIKWLANSDPKIKNARLVSEAALDKLRWSPSNAQTTTQSTDAAGTTPPNKEVKPFVFAPETPILQAIETIIKNSSYLEDALRVVFDAAKPPTDTGRQQQEKDNKVKVGWYHVSAEFTESDWDDKINQFAGLITYVIETYETPIITNVYTNPGVPYYGPHKRYEYWFTGKNSEVLSYEQQINNGYFTVSLGAVGPESEEQGKQGDTDTPVAPNKQTNQDRSSRLDNGLAAQNAYLTNLYDPSAYAQAKITIMGDPDFLLPESTSSINDLYNRFYGTDGFTVKANGGQVFIEINFKEAEDYGYKRDQNNVYKRTVDGLLSVNESIQFWKYPKKIRELQEKNNTPGVSYQVITVESNFGQGKFTQLLTCVLNPFADIQDEESSETQREELEEVTVTDKKVGPVPSNSTSTAGTGTLSDPPVNPASNNVGPSTVTTNNESTVTTTTSSNDDAQEATPSRVRQSTIITPPPSAKEQEIFELGLSSDAELFALGYTPDQIAAIRRGEDPDRVGS